MTEASNSRESSSSTEERIRAATEALRGDQPAEVASLAATWPPGETSTVLEALPQPQRLLLWEQLPEEQRGMVLASVGEQVRADLLTRLEVPDVVQAAGTLDTPELAAVVTEAPQDLRDAILESLGPAEREWVEENLAYPEDTAGRLMTREWVAVREHVRLEAVKRYLRQRGSLPHHTAALMVVDRDGRFLGELSVEALLTRDEDLTVSELMSRDVARIPALTPLSEVAALFQRRDLVSLPVVDEQGRLIGRITLDDAIDLVHAEAEQPMMRMAGLEPEEDLLAPILASARRRLFWLGLNLATAFLAAWVIGLFEATIEEIVALAILMPIVASMGGIAGSQTLTLAIRGLALGHITDANTRWLATKEVTLSVINGVVWALVVGVIAWLWFAQLGVALVLASAMIINLLAAAVSGLAIPLTLRRMGLDAALSGSVILTTVTDVVGFMSFLGLATLLLL